MKRELQLRRRLQSLDALGEAVGAMKSLSAHHFREARENVEAARTYREGVERIRQLFGRASRPILGAGEGGAGLVVIGAELGLCGGYNAQLVEAAVAHRAELGEGPTHCVGRRAATLLGRREVAIDGVYDGPTSVQGITGLLLKLAEDTLSSYAAQGLASVDIVSSRFVGVGRAAPERVRLLPVEAPEDDGERRAARYIRRDFAFAATREHLYITLYDLILDALASEHGARLAATQSAEHWLDERTQRLRRHLMATRREASTQEVIEIAAGARARGGRS